MINKPPLQNSSFMEKSSSPLRPRCFPSQELQKTENRTVLCSCQRAPRSNCLSAIGNLIHFRNKFFIIFLKSITGVLCLVLGYTAIGAILFVTLEGENNEVVTETAVAAIKPYPRTDSVNSEIRTR